MKKIFVLTNSLISGGAEKQSIFLTYVLSRYYDSCLVVFNRKEDNDAKLLQLAENYKLKLIFINGNKARQFYELLVLMRRQKPEFVFSFLMYTNILNGIVGRIARAKNRFGGIRNSYIPPIKLLIQRIIHNYFLSGSITNNYSSLKKLEKTGFQTDRIIVIPNCISAYEKIITRSYKDCITLITSGRFVKQKNYNALFRIYRKVLDKNSGKKIKLYIIGFGELENEIRLQLAQYNNNEVEIVINPDDLDSYYRQADIYISTSFYEGMSNSIMEAMAYCLPVVATNVGDNNQLIIDNETGFVVELKNEDEYAEKLVSLINNYNMRIRMGHKGYKHITMNYSEQAFDEKIRSLLESQTKT